MVSKSGMGYTLQDIPLLIERARALCFPPDFPSTSKADWLLEGEIGSTKWVTKNSGKEYFDQKWRNGATISFDSLLPNKSSLINPANGACFSSLQKWSFAFRSGWLGHDPTPKYWVQTTRWAMTLTSWIYLKEEQFFPEEHGYALLDKDDLKILFEELSIDGWVTALRIIERSFISLYSLTYERPPSSDLISALPDIPASVINDVSHALESHGLFVKRDPKDQRIICRKYLASQLGTTIKRFDNISIRRFLRKFEAGSTNYELVLPGRTATQYPQSHTLKKNSHGEPDPPTKQAMLLHATYCLSFLSAEKMPSIEIPKTGFNHDSIAELKSFWGESVHRQFIPISDSLAVLNEAACWITQYGDSLISYYKNYLNVRGHFLEQIECYSYTRDHALRLVAKEYCKFRLLAEREEQISNSEFEVVRCLGLEKAISEQRRTIIPGHITLFQALFALIGACAYAIGMMKPLRDGELAEIPFDCMLRHNKTNGCWATFPVEKSERQGLMRPVKRPIPYLTYLAMTLMQRLGRVTSEFHSDGLTPTRLFYFPAGDGLEPPVKAKASNGINRCMDIFCDYVNLPLNLDGTRRYFRIHELRKSFLLLLSWDDSLHGLECGAWMAAHRDESHIQAYTDANLEGDEINEWEAEQVEIKLMELECDESEKVQDNILSLYNELKKHFGVSQIFGLPSGKFESYVQNIIASGRYVVRPLTFEAENGSIIIDIGVFAKEVDNE